MRPAPVLPVRWETPDPPTVCGDENSRGRFALGPVSTRGAVKIPRRAAPIGGNVLVH